MSKVLVPTRIVEHVPGFITSNPDDRGGIPCIAGSRYSVSDVLRYLGGTMEREEMLGVVGLDEDALRELLRWVAEFVNDQGRPSPVVFPGVVRRRAQEVAEAWRKMLNQPEGHVQYRAATRLGEVAPDLVRAIKNLTPYL